MSYVVITDSASNLSDEQIKRFDLEVISYIGTINGEEYLCYKPMEDEEKEGKRFYDLLREGADIRTSLINPNRLYVKFEEYIKAGQDVFFIGLSSGLSGTYQSAVTAAEMITDAYPNRKCVVVDSLGASLGAGLFACKAGEMRKAGKSIEEVVAYIEENRLRMRQVFTVDDLKYLKKGGRIGGAIAKIGTVLSIKPMLKATNEGNIGLSGIARGRKKSIENVIQDVCSTIVDAENQIIAIAHCDCKEVAEYVKEKINEKFPNTEIWINYYDKCTGSHVGPGAFAVFFLGANRD